MSNDLLKLENQICFPLYALSREIIKLYKPLLEPFNLTYTQYITLMVLWEHPQINFKTLGQILHLDSGTLTPVIKKLEEKGFVSKHRTKEDDRVVMVVLSQAGRDLKDEIKSVPEALSCLLEGNEETLSTLKKALDTLLEETSQWGNPQK